MLKMILEMLANALGAVSNFFRWKSSPVAQHDGAEARVSAEEAKARDRRAEVNRAVHEGDEEAVNRLVNGLAILWAMALAACILGCVAPKAPRYVAADRVVTCTTNELGQAVMWHVPPLVMEELLNAKLELEEVKHENKVKEMLK